MRGRDAEVTEFVEARGPALWRTASLLAIDVDDAELLLVHALAQAHREWSSLTRDQRVEQRTSELVCRRFLDEHETRGTLDVAPEEPQNVSPARAALASLTPRQRAALVLPTYAGVTDGECAAWMHYSPEDVASLRVEAEEKFRERLGASDTTSLLALLNAAALNDVPPDLAERALAETKPGHRRAMVAIGGLAVAAVLAAALIPWGGSDDATGAEGAVNEWGVPRDLTVPSDPTSLMQAPIDRASTAFLFDGLPLVASEAGEIRSVLDPNGDPELLRLRWSQAVLSPDGTRLLLVRVVPDVRGRLAPTSSRTSIGAVYVVNVTTGEMARIPELATSPRASGIAGISRANVAWAPDSAGFACACSKRLTVAQLEESGTDTSVSRTEVRAKAVAWGQPGLAVDDPRHGWRFVNLPLSVDGSLIQAEAFVASYTDPPTFLTVSPLSIYALAADSKPDGGHCV
ncbi:MAG TPA: hypothetical protein VFX15_06645, partial [Actinomycetes bacterium]|nr:hypothetical protein [Actinomycetes bacterium]